MVQLDDPEGIYSRMYTLFREGALIGSEGKSDAPIVVTIYRALFPTINYYLLKMR